MSNIVASIISWFNGILLGVINVIVSILGVFTGNGTNEPLFQGILDSLATSTLEQPKIFDLAITIFVAIIGINIFQETIRYFTDTDVGLDRSGIIKVVRESMGVVAFLVVYSLLFTGGGIGWKAISSISGVASDVANTAAGSLLDTVFATSALKTTTDLLSGVEGASLEFIIMLMAFGLIMGMINCIAQLVGTFIVGLVGIIVGVIIFPIHISLSMLGRSNSAGKTLIMIINAIVLIGVILGLGQAIVGGRLIGAFSTQALDWRGNIIKYLVYFGLLEGYKSLVQRANGVMTDLLASVFHVG